MSHNPTIPATEQDIEFLDVREFHVKLGFIVNDVPVHLTRRKLMERAEFLSEELREFNEAIATQDLAQLADALVDIVYVAKGTAVQLGLPWKMLWDDVHRANMGKERGITSRGHKVDAAKPKGWIGPRTQTILNRRGYQEHLYLTEDGLSIDEAKCLDDDLENLP